MVVNACRNKKLEFEGEIVEMKTFDKKSKQARNKVSQVQLLYDSIENLSDMVSEIPKRSNFKNSIGFI